MMKKLLAVLLAGSAVCVMLTGCGDDSTYSGHLKLHSIATQTKPTSDASSSESDPSSKEGTTTTTKSTTTSSSTTTTTTTTTTSETQATYETYWEYTTNYDATTAAPVYTSEQAPVYSQPVTTTTPNYYEPPARSEMTSNNGQNNY